MKKINVKSVDVPVYRNSGFILENASKTKQAFLSEEENPTRSPENYIYSRYRNPTVVAAEESIMNLENSRWALLTQSGMSAIDTALSIFHNSDTTGTWLFFDDIYGGTNTYIDTILIKRRGINICRYYADNNKFDLAKLEELIKKTNPGLMYFEGVSNPMLIIADGEEIIKLAKKHNIFVIVDNTFGTPYLWKPLEHGADLVVHSVTKYIAGHGNITGGVVCGNNEQFEKDAVEYRKFVGHMISPDDAYRLNTQIKTFDLRFKKQNESAEKLANRLSVHPGIEKVYYPGLPSHSTHQEANKLFKGKGYGGMITFDIKGINNMSKEKNRDLFIEALSENIPLVPSLGDANSILLPVEAVWGKKYPLPGMVRLSIGIESYDILEKNIMEALKVIKP